MFDKFLGKKPPVHNPEPSKKRGQGGRPRKPKHLKHPRSKDLDRCGPDGRVLKQFLKRPKTAGRYSTPSKRKTRRERWKRQYRKGALAQKAYRQSLKRRYYQSRSLARLKAVKHGLDPLHWYQLTYADFLLLWETAPMIYLPEKQCMVEAKSLINNPIKLKNQCTYLDRLDKGQPFTRENCRVFYRGKPL